MIGDTIHAVASPPGSSARAVLRVSGPSALAAAAAVFRPVPSRCRAQIEGAIEVAGARLPALLLVLPGPGSYTGEDTVELHVPGSALLCAELVDAMVCAVGPHLRAARPGEFTARACLNGRLDALQAEGVLLLIHGEDARASASGAAWLGGALTAAFAAIRAELQDALAAIESGLDFEAGETGEVPVADVAGPLDRAAERIAGLRAELPAAVSGGEVLLLGASNAGKSSLCNALAQRDAVLVDATPGTTRDLLRVPIEGGAVLWDAPGDLADPGELDRCALRLRDRLGARAAAALLVVDPAAPWLPPSVLPQLAVVCTKADCRSAAAIAAAQAALAAPMRGAPLRCFVVSAHTGAGIPALRAFLNEHAGSGSRDVLAPLRNALDEAGTAVRAARDAWPQAAELAGAELQRALVALAVYAGEHSPEHLLDRIYARFCLGK